MPTSTSIGPYGVLRLINQGGQGGIYLGYDSRLHRRVAIKLLRLPAPGADRDALLNEAQLVASIQSPKVVQIHDLVIGQDNVALIMEYVPGCDLEEFLSIASPSVATVLAVATDLAGALAVARQQHIVHGDLKASNVLVTESGRVKLTDFGIARAGHEQVATGHAAGSPGCVSPEQFLGRPLDIRSDLFSLGCLMYRMLTGEHPFLRDGQLNAHALLELDPRPVEELAEGLPAGLAELIHGLLQKDPNDRPRDTLQVRFALRDISRGIPLSVSSTLLQESRPCFREEAPGDMPLAIPADLRRGGRSRLRPFRFDELWSWRSLTLKSGAMRLGILASTVALAAIVALVRLSQGETRIHFDQPDVRVTPGMALPSGVSEQWLVEQVKQVAGARLGPLFVTGPVGATEVRALYAVPRHPDIEEKLSVALRCNGDMCLFALDREWDDRRESGQAMLFADMPTERWRQAIQSVARNLYAE